MEGLQSGRGWMPREEFRRERGGAVRQAEHGGEQREVRQARAALAFTRGELRQSVLGGRRGVDADFPEQLR
jgi:hypothetical protein